MMRSKELKITAKEIPPIIFGTSGLGNLFVARDEATKCEIVKEGLSQSKDAVVFDSTEKYEAALVLESSPPCLKKFKRKT